MRQIRSLVDFAPDAALAIGSDRRVVAWNERAARLLGYSRDQAVAQPCYDVLQATLPTGEHLCSPECEGKLCFAYRSPFTVRACSLRHKDGHRLEASISTIMAPGLNQEGVKASAVALVFLRPRREVVTDVRVDQRLRVYTLGRFGLSVGGVSVPLHSWHRKQALTLLKLLVTNRAGTMHREQIIECLWPSADERKGAGRLKVIVCFLRQRLRAAGLRADVIATQAGGYALQGDAVWLDCEAFETQFKRARLLQRHGHLTNALVWFEKVRRIYRGDYLSEERYADWCAVERERLRELHFDLLGNMVDGYLECGDHERAVDICRDALAAEPCRERFHRALMICLFGLGQYDRVVAHYRRCQQILRAELDTTPAPETERLYRELIARSGGPAPAAIARTAH